MEAYYTLSFVILASLVGVISSDELTQPCANNDITCISKYFQNDKNSVRSEKATACDVLIELPYFNTTVFMPKVHISGLDNATIESFTISADKQKAMLVFYFPQLLLQGDCQMFRFHQTGQFDIEVKIPLIQPGGDLYTTTIFNVTNGYIDVGSADTNSEANSFSPITIPPEIQKAGKKHPFIAELIASALAQPEVLVREYALTIGKTVTDLCYKRFFN